MFQKIKTFILFINLFIFLSSRKHKSLFLINLYFFALHDMFLLYLTSLYFQFFQGCLHRSQPYSRFCFLLLPKHFDLFGEMLELNLDILLTIYIFLKSLLSCVLKSNPMFLQKNLFQLFFTPLFK